jgi:hypothetical protein
MNPKIIARNKAHLFELIKNAIAINNYWLKKELDDSLANDFVEKKKIKI